LNQQPLLLNLVKMSITLKRVETKADKHIFIDLPHKLYENDLNYVPELYVAMDEHLNPKKNPFLQHATVELYLAYKNNEVVGRIATILNDHYNEYHKVNISFFGFFDTIDDAEVANTLLDKAMAFAKEQGTTAVYGPTNFNTSTDTAGLLVDGFDSPPIVQMTYNASFYKTLIENYGFEKDMDLFAYWLDTNNVNKKSVALSERLEERLKSKGITIRNIKKKNFDKEVESIRAIYRSAWEDNWGFVPPTDAEFSFLAEGLKMVVDEKYVYVAEDNGKMVGFAVALPNINEIIKTMKKGRLFPFGIFKLLLNKSKVKKVRVALLGVVKDYRKQGIEAVFYSNFIKTAQANGIEGGEASWILENNEMMNKGLENLNGVKYKTYRIYSKKL
jgi:GNAT superfamily N-acetyltransferase